MDVERLIENASPTMGRAIQVTDRHGHEAVLVVAKLTFAVSPRGDVSLAVPPSPVRFLAEPYPDHAGLRYPADVAPEKPGTDVILAGHAIPPRGRRSTSMEVHLRVGPLAAGLRVHGARFWLRNAKELVPGPAALLAPTPLASDLTFGAAPPAESSPAPVIEDLERPGEPATLGPLPEHAPSRTRHLGTMDEAWSMERAPILPVDFDPRFHSCASPGLWSSTPLRGDEPVEIVGATPEGRWTFQLPRFAPRFFVQETEDEADEVPSHLDTFLVDADHGRVELVWRAAVRIPPRPRRLRRIAIVQHRPLPEEMLHRALEELDRQEGVGREAST